MIRVLIAEDETLVRAGIRTLLERQDGMTVVAEATDGEEALARLRYGIDVALLDVRMPRRGGASVLEKVHVSSILSKLGVRDRVQAVLRALESGLI